MLENTLKNVNSYVNSLVQEEQKAETKHLDDYKKLLKKHDELEIVKKESRINGDAVKYSKTLTEIQNNEESQQMLLDFRIVAEYEIERLESMRDDLWDKCSLSENESYKMEKLNEYQANESKIRQLKQNLKNKEVKSLISVEEFEKQVQNIYKDLDKYISEVNEKCLAHSKEIKKLLNEFCGHRDNVRNTIYNLQKNALKKDYFQPCLSGAWYPYLDSTLRKIQISDLQLYLERASLYIDTNKPQDRPVGNKLVQPINDHYSDLF